MKKMKIMLYMVIVGILAFTLGCGQTQETTDNEIVNHSLGAVISHRSNRQQEQFAIGQPIPQFDWSLERHLVIELYKVRNKKVLTHSVWRSDYGLVEGDCPSMGYGIPYDTSLTNPLRGQKIKNSGVVAIGQAEPNGIFLSQNTNATWVMCIGGAGLIEPVSVESKVTTYPGRVIVNYKTNRVIRSGAATVMVQW